MIHCNSGALHMYIDLNAYQIHFKIEYICAKFCNVFDSLFVIIIYDYIYETMICVHISDEKKKMPENIMGVGKQLYYL